MKWLTGAILFAFAFLLLYAGSDLPAMGVPDAPASVGVAATYVENAKSDTATPNVVTAVLADYRGFDTLGEITVVFTAALSCLLILRGREPKRPEA